MSLVSKKLHFSFRRRLSQELNWYAVGTFDQTLTVILFFIARGDVAALYLCHCYHSHLEAGFGFIKTTN